MLRLNLSRKSLTPSSEGEVWGPPEIARRLSGLHVLGALLRYRDVRLQVDDVNEMLSSRPLLAARLLSRGRARVEDARGGVKEIGWAELLRVLGADAAGALAWPRLRAQIRRDLASIGPASSTYTLTGDGVLSVRTDLWFGIEAGGAVAHTAGILNAMAERVAPVRLLASHALPMLSPRIDVVSPARAWPRMPRPEWALLAFNVDLLRAGEALPRPRFVYQRHGLYGYAGATLARRWAVPLVLEYNGSEVWIGDHWGKSVAARDVAVEIERRMLGAADLVTAVSTPLVELAIASGVRADRVMLCPNAVDVDLYHPAVDGAAMRERYGLGEAIVIGFVGTFGPWHGAALLAQAFAQMRAHLAHQREVRLLMIGDGPELPAVRRIVEAEGCAEAVVFTGLVPQPDAARHLAAADILVSPTLPNPDGSEFFGSPTKLFEYMAMGRAIVASNIAQLGEVLKHEHSGILTAPGDCAALAEALARTCADADLRCRLGRAARYEAETRHQWKHRVEAVEHALEAIAGRG